MFISLSRIMKSSYTYVQNSENKLDCDFDDLNSMYLKTSENHGTMKVERVIQRSHSPATTQSRSAWSSWLRYFWITPRVEAPVKPLSVTSYTHNKTILPHIKSASKFSTWIHCHSSYHWAPLRRILLYILSSGLKKGVTSFLYFSP